MIEGTPETALSYDIAIQTVDDADVPRAVESYTFESTNPNIYVVVDESEGLAAGNYKASANYVAGSAGNGFLRFTADPRFDGQPSEGPLVWEEPFSILPAEATKLVATLTPKA